MCKKVGEIMLPPNVTANLDFLANIGVLDFDAASYIAGSSPRYIGYTNNILPPIVHTPMDGKHLVQPSEDSFNGKTASDGSLWTKILLSAAAISAAIIGGPKLGKSIKSLKLPSIKNLFPKFKFKR